jgi:hypothetical protein
MDRKPRTEKTKKEKRIIYLQIAKTRVLKDHNVATTALMEYER